MRELMICNLRHCTHLLNCVLLRDALFPSYSIPFYYCMIILFVVISSNFVLVDMCIFVADCVVVITKTL